ncbi:RNase P subunit p30-domain-containing protein [Amylostereum chailletii]|nr:RNase P subunit p30-domain-containing protein [Amylostereum chailletii]
MYFDLNVQVPAPASTGSGPGQSQSKKGKGKQAQPPSTSAPPSYSPAQIAAIESRVDLLVHLGYTVLAFAQTVRKKVDPKTFVNALDPLLSQLRKRPGIIYLKRLTIVLDEDSEKGFGLINANAALFAPYDILALLPTTEASFAYASLTHTAPSPLCAHILALPLTLPRLPFRMKHTVVRTALRNGAVFEINYAGALGADEGADAGGGGAAKRNWWAAATEVVRVTKGKGVVLSSGAAAEAELRAPRDVGNLTTFAGLAANLAHDAATATPRSLVLRAQTRKTYRAVFSEPKVVIPDAPPPAPAPSTALHHPDMEAESTPINPTPSTLSEEPTAGPELPQAVAGANKKRPREEGPGDASGKDPAVDGGARKKKRKGKGGAQGS